MKPVIKASLLGVSAMIAVVGGQVASALPEEIKTARWIGVEKGKLACSVMKRIKKYDSASLDPAMELYGGATYKYGQEAYSRWYREGKDSLAGVAIEAQHNYMRANCSKEFDKYIEALTGYPPLRPVPVTWPQRPKKSIVEFAK